MDDCEECGQPYDVREVSANYGSNHNKTCWPCLKDWIAACGKDPYRVGLGMLRNELPHHVDPYVLGRYKEAFEHTRRLLDEVA